MFERAVHGKLQIERAIEASGIETVKRIVQVGAGIACVSKAAVSREFKARRLSQINVTGLNLHRDIILLFHKQKYVSQALHQFLQFARNHARF